MKPARRAFFALAMRLGMTVQRLLDEMSMLEFSEWTQFFAEQARAADPNAPMEIDWENMTPDKVGALFGRN